MPAHVVTRRACCRLTFSLTQQKGLSESVYVCCLSAVKFIDIHSRVTGSYFYGQIKSKKIADQQEVRNKIICDGKLSCVT